MGESCPSLKQDTAQRRGSHGSARHGLGQSPAPPSEADGASAVMLAEGSMFAVGAATDLRP